MENEIFVPIKNHETTHVISLSGKIKSIERIVRFGSQFRKVKPKVLKPQLHRTGYYFYGLVHNNKHEFLHRLMAQTFIPNPNNKSFVNHIDGNKTNNSLDNLEWCTRQENEDHAFRTGLKNYTGSRNPQAKLNEDDIIEIKRLRECGIKMTELGNLFNVSEKTIWRILHNRIWKHV